MTGGAGFLGQEQASWAKYAVKTLAPQYGPEGQARPWRHARRGRSRPALALAQKYIADKSVVAILGPSTSGNAGATAKPFFQAGLAALSPSATHTDLTIGTAGDPLIGTPAFFRDVPWRLHPGPDGCAVHDQQLKVKKVVLIDFQEPYSVGLCGRGRPRC